VQKRNFSAFTQALAGLGWTGGRNLRLDLRYYGTDINRIGALVQESVGLQPDIILALGGTIAVALERGCRKRKNQHEMRVSEGGVLKSVTNRSGCPIILAVAKTHAASAGSAQTGEPAAAAGCPRIRAPGGCCHRPGLD